MSEAKNTFPTKKKKKKRLKRHFFKLENILRSRKKKDKLLIRHNLRQSFFFISSHACSHFLHFLVIYLCDIWEALPAGVSSFGLDLQILTMVSVHGAALHTSNLSLQRWMMKTRNLRNPAALQGKTHRSRKLLPFLFAIPPNESQRTGLSSVG